MKITQMNVTPIAMADPPLRNAPGIHEPYVNRIIVELVGENGLSGWGEQAYSTTLLADLQAIAPHIVGIDSTDQAAIMRVVEGHFADDDDRIDPILRNFRTDVRKPGMTIPRAFSPIEVAALDLTGRSLGVRVVDLLGGPVRDRVSFSAYLFYKHAGGGGEGEDKRPDEYGEAMTPEQVTRQARQMIDTHGFKSIKFKGGVLEPALEIESVRQMRAEFGPDMPIRIDPNCAWTVETSIKVAQDLQNELEYFEDPTASIPGMGEVRAALLAQGIDLPQATNMCVTEFSQIPESLQHDAVQVILGDHHYWGGLRATTQLGRICEVFGIGMSMHSNTHFAISLMAMTHVAAATRALTYDVDTHYPWLDAGDEFAVGGKIRFEDGSLAIPDAPGLGIEIDRAGLQRQHELFLRIPYRDRDDVGHMQRTVDPNWTEHLPRW
ncbi:MAG: hypothetical protein KC435_11135 [Thermomicrobiales bacterium]|nr:hypothetical protein [Thermomicrobiales bacterium]